jgi:hypothetical protein
LAYFLLDVVGELDLSSIYAHYEKLGHVALDGTKVQANGNA